jgi:hypothetical protein
MKAPLRVAASAVLMIALGSVAPASGRQPRADAASAAERALAVFAEHLLRCGILASNKTGVWAQG